MRLTALVVYSICLMQNAAHAQQSALPPEYKPKTSVGQRMPSFTVTDTSGNRFAIDDQKGKVVLVNFWATWCGPCSSEIPRLEKEVWQKHKGHNFAMLAVAREQSTEEISNFREKQGFTYPIAGDPNRATYKLFADAGIPRSYVVGPDGTILFQSEGYNPAEFDRMKKIIDEQLAK